MEWVNRDFSKDRTILDGLRVHSNSEKTAVLCGERSVSYRDLIRKSKRLARGLALCGVGKGDYVILSMSRSTDFVCGMLGILFAGAAYVAIDREWPAERLDFIRQDCAAAAVLDDDLFGRLIDSDARAELPEPEESDAFAVYYTSGSTGKPKGTVTHHAVFLHEAMPLPGNICSYETARTCRIVFSMGNFAYGATACDIVFSLYNGLSLVLATDQERLSPALLGESMKKHHADALLGTPSALLAHLEDPAFAEGFAGLKRVILTGEALSERDAKRIAAKTNAVLFDAFGASEVRNYSFTRIIPGEPIGLGAATDGAELLVLDRNGDPAREGELCIGGIPGRYGCYLGLPALTAGKFTIHEKYGRIYHTGDLAVVEDKGRVRLSGRKDGMQKLHGQRLEPREIEIALESFEGLKQAAVGIRGEGKRAVLCAWYTSDQEIDERALVEYLSASLPSYMVPAFFKRLKTMPLSSSGKLDRGALPDIRPERTAYQAPVTEQEREVCEAFEQVLGCGHVGVEDHFFTIGGDSIHGMQLICLFSDRYGVKLSFRDLVTHPTPKLLAVLLHSCQKREEKEDFEEKKPEPDFLRIPKELRTIAQAPDTEAILPASGATTAYLYMKSVGIRDRFNRNRIRAELSCAFTEEEFRNRVAVLLQNHPALRSSFVKGEDGKYWQIIHKSCEVPLWFKDLSGLSEEGARQFISGFWQVMGDENLFSAAYFVLAENRSVLLFSADHTVADGVSVHVIANELAEEGYENRKADGYIAHRRRILDCESEFTPALRDYFDKSKNEIRTVDPMFLGTAPIKIDTVALSLSETDALMRGCAALGVLPYCFLAHAYGETILAVSGCEEVWLQSLESGRYAEWGDELRIVGNLIFAAPVGVSKTMTPQQFQEDLFRIRDCHILSDLPLFYDPKWQGLIEGIVSNNFVEPTGTIARFEILGDDMRRGNSVTIENGSLTIKLRHMDRSDINDWYERVATELRSRLLSAGDGLSPEAFGIPDEETPEGELASHGSVKSFLASSRIPFITQLQYEVAQHCNLKCKGCAHFAPLSGKKFGDLESFTRDLERIHDLVNQIGEFRLLGGEPLLNEDLYLYVQEARRIYPHTPITIVTNGIRLASLPERLLLTMKQCHAAFSVSLYPPVRNYVRLQIERLRREGILFREIYDAETFVAYLNRQGDSDKTAAERYCAASVCHTFEDGKIYKCPTSMRISVYEEHFCPKGTFPLCSLNLYDKELTAGKLLEFLTEPIELCSFCGKLRPYTWERAGKKPRAEDWYGNGRI